MLRASLPALFLAGRGMVRCLPHISLYIAAASSVTATWSQSKNTCEQTHTDTDRVK